MSVFSVGPSNGIYTKSTTNVLGLGATIGANGQFVAATGPTIQYVLSNPNGVVTANTGSIAMGSSGELYVNKGGTTWAGASLVPSGLKGGYQYFYLPAPIGPVGDNTAGFVVVPGLNVSFPANTLSAGSSIRVRVAGRQAVAIANSSMALQLFFNATSLGTVAPSASAFGNTYGSVFDFQLVCRTAGAGGSGETSFQGSTAGASSTNATSPIVNTTIINNLTLQVLQSVPNVGTNFTLNTFTVDFFP